MVSQIVLFCNTNLIPITPSAALTVWRGALPICKSISMKKDKILKIDQSNFQAVIQPGLVNEDFQNELEKINMFYPPDPASKGSCTLGGNIALNAGGLKPLNMVLHQIVLNLELVLPNGKTIWTGSNTLKNSTGYNLTQLLVGSEGTLGIITKAVVKFIPKPKQFIVINSIS